MSVYVQLARATSLNRLSIMRSFDPDDLRRPLPSELLDELRWQEEMARKTSEIYENHRILAVSNTNRCTIVFIIFPLPGET